MWVCLRRSDMEFVDHVIDGSLGEVGRGRLIKSGPNGIDGIRVVEGQEIVGQRVPVDFFQETAIGIVYLHGVGSWGAAEGKFYRGEFRRFNAEDWLAAAPLFIRG